MTSAACRGQRALLRLTRTAQALATRPFVEVRMASSATAVVVREFGGPEVLQVAEKTVAAPGPWQVLVNIKAAGVTPSDTYVRLGPGGPYANIPRLLPALPYTPGKCGAGIVEAVGEGVNFLKVGDRVYTAGALTGTYASHALCDAGSVHGLPEPATFAQGSTLGVNCATAEYALRFRAAFKAGERIFVHGASGSVGLAAVQLARRIGGAESLVVGSAGTEAGEKAVLAAGADKVVNHRRESYQAELRADVPHGFDVVLEMSAHVNLPADLSLAARRARVCIIGSRSQDVPINPRHFMASEVDVRGVFLSQAGADELKEVHESLQTALADGSLRPTVACELPLTDAAEAHREVMQPAGGGASGSVALIVA